MTALRIAVVLAVIGLAACGGKPLHPSKWFDPVDEIPPGPGLFSGEDGEFVLYRN
jgi:hypothetical protein